MKKPTKKQQVVLDNLAKVEGFNEMDPKYVAGVLKRNLNLWVDGIFDPQVDDTLYLYPRKGKEKDLELVAYKELTADEIDYMPLYDYNNWPDTSKNPRILARGGLRIWWD